MTERKTIKAKEIVADIRSGMSDQQLMSKYELSAEGLASVFNRLQESGTVKSSELLGRSFSHDDTANLGDLRKRPRHYFVLPLVIREAGDPRNTGEILDASEKGVAVKGMKARPGQTHRLVIDAWNVDGIRTLSFEAVCRWNRRDDHGSHLAGFEITKISASDLTELRKLIRGATLR